jgi:hypothetical protein
MNQQYARVTLETPEKEYKRTLRQELKFEIEAPNIQDEYTVKF